MERPLADADGSGPSRRRWGGGFARAHVVGDAEVAEPDVHRILEGGGLDLLGDGVPEAEGLLAIDGVDGCGKFSADAHVVGLA